MSSKITSVRVDSELIELSNTLILHRAFRKMKKAETFSTLVNNLIREAWEREKKIIELTNKDDK